MIDSFVLRSVATPLITLRFLSGIAALRTTPHPSSSRHAPGLSSASDRTDPSRLPDS